MMDERVEWKILGMNTQRMTVRCVSRKQNDNRCELLRDVRVFFTHSSIFVSPYLLKIAMISIFAKWFQTYFTVAPYFR